VNHARHALPRPSPLPSQQPLDTVLAEVRRRFYRGADAHVDAVLQRAFFRDRRMILYALSWPATWLRQRALTCSPARYHSLLIARLEAIVLHGDSARFAPLSAYFPTYLLACLQDWFRHHGDELYDELKHLRNAIDKVLSSAPLAAQVQRDAQHLDVIAAAHKLIQPARRRAGKSDPAQLSLF